MRKSVRIELGEKRVYTLIKYGEKESSLIILVEVQKKRP